MPLIDYSTVPCWFGNMNNRGPGRRRPQCPGSAPDGCRGDGAVPVAPTPDVSRFLFIPNIDSCGPSSLHIFIQHPLSPAKLCLSYQLWTWIEISKSFGMISRTPMRIYRPLRLFLPGWRTTPRWTFQSRRDHRNVGPGPTSHRLP